MKRYLCFLPCLVLSSLIASAQGDTSKRDPLAHPRFADTALPVARFHKVNFSFNWFEMGPCFPFKEKKLRDLPNGMNYYLYSPKVSFSGNFFGIGIYYKDRWGLSAIGTFSDFSVDDADFRNYITTQYPGHYIPYGAQAHIYSLNGIDYRLSCRFHKGHLIFEPQFQFGINDCQDFHTHFVLKEMGSNQFIEYDIKEENTKKLLLSYRAALMIHWCFNKPDRPWNVEPGLRFDLVVVPTNFHYTISSTPYNAPATVYEMDVKRLRPALNITLFMSIFRK